MTDEMKKSEAQKLDEEITNIRLQIHSLKNKINEISEKKKALERDPKPIPLKLREKYSSILDGYTDYYFTTWPILRLIKLISAGKDRGGYISSFTDEQYERYCYVLERYLQLTQELCDELCGEMECGAE